MIGTTVSHYTILSKLGEGGMGVVYKAEDTTLKRVVALKFLPAQLGTNENDKARFLLEAQAAASLNHPNICTIHGIEEHGGQLFIVMEFVDGQTLRERMGSMSQKHGLDVGTFVAEGLAAAHEKGIVHRDIKPENIMIRKDGIAQIMDFGLAKLRTASSKINRLTKEGSTVGTAGYMSPEQVQGHDADHRSDIFSLGVVLYELFTGQLPFRGVHETALMYEIVNVDAPPMATIRHDIDANLDAIILECLEKDPADRYQSVAEVAKDLKKFKRESSRARASRITGARSAYGGSAQSPVQPTGVLDAQAIVSVGTTAHTVVPTAPSRRRSSLGWFVAALFFLTTLGALAYHVLVNGTVAQPEVIRAAILPPDRHTFNVRNGGHLALSPDGRVAAFVLTDTGGTDRLWVRPIASSVPIALQGTEDASYPFWSPDSRTIAFFAQGKLKRIDARGGPTQTICPAAGGRGGSWSKNGTIVFSPGPYEPLSRVSAAGGAPSVLTTLDTTRNEVSHRWPMFLADGDHFLFIDQTATAATDSDAVHLGSLEKGSASILCRGNSNLAYSSGHLLFVRQKSLMAQPFDQRELRFTGDAVPIAEDIQYNSARSRAIFSASDDGAVIYQSGRPVETDIALFDRSGTRTVVMGEVGVLRARFSPDGGRIAYEKADVQTGRSDIWVYDLTRRITARLTFDSGLNVVPLWSPSGDSIAFSSNRAGHFGIYVKSAEGTGDARLLFGGPLDCYATSWSSDGRLMSLTTLGDPKTKNDLWMLNVTAERTLTPFFKTEFNEWLGRFSPNNRWLAFQSDETGKNEVYVRSADGSGGKWQISSGGGTLPWWGPGGKTLYYGGANRTQRCAYLREVGATLVVDSLSTLFDLESRGITDNAIEPSPDGRLFLGTIQDQRGAVAPMTLVVHWNMDLSKP